MMNIINGYINLLDAQDGQTRRLLIQKGFNEIKTTEGFVMDTNEETMINKLFPLFHINNDNNNTDPLYNVKLVVDQRYLLIKKQLTDLKDLIQKDKEKGDYSCKLQYALIGGDVFLGATSYMYDQKKHLHHIETLGKIGNMTLKT